VPNDANGSWDIFITDLHTGATELVSVSSSGEQANNGSSSPQVSSDGRWVAFTSHATNLAPDTSISPSEVFVRDRRTGMTVQAPYDGLILVFEVKVVTSISGDGACVAYRHASGEFNDTFAVWLEWKTGLTTFLPGPEACPFAVQRDPSLSYDGRFASYSNDSVAGTLQCPEGWQIFVHDMTTGSTSQVSVSSEGTPADGQSQQSSMSGDGRYVSYWSEATNLVPFDRNGFRDVFLRDVQLGQTIRVSVSNANAEANAAPARASSTSIGPRAFRRGPRSSCSTPSRTTPRCTASRCRTGCKPSRPEGAPAARGDAALSPAAPSTTSGPPSRGRSSAGP
jgi:Tol biopolymer transport system component